MHYSSIATVGKRSPDKQTQVDLARQRFYDCMRGGAGLRLGFHSAFITHRIVADQLGEADKRSGYFIESEPVTHVLVTFQRLFRKLRLQKHTKIKFFEVEN